jgi:hypothetical protein
MSIYLSHVEVRAFAKALRELTGRSVRNSHILEDIAASVGLRPDAMMHRLKTPEAGSSGRDSTTFPSLSMDDTSISALARRLGIRTGSTDPRTITVSMVMSKLPSRERSPDEDPIRQLGRLMIESDAYRAFCVRNAEISPLVLLRFPQDGVIRGPIVDDAHIHAALMTRVLDVYVDDPATSKAAMVEMSDIPGLYGLRLQWFSENQRFMAICIRKDTDSSSALGDGSMPRTKKQVLVFDEYELMRQSRPLETPDFLKIRYGRDDAIETLSAAEIRRHDIEPIGNGWNKLRLKD